MNLQDRVVVAAEVVLQREGAVGPLEQLQQIGFLHFSHVAQWRKGHEYYADLESHIQCGEKKLTQTWRHFLEWVRKKRLEPIAATYTGGSRFGAEPLQVTIDGDPQLEEFFRTQYRPADLSPAKQQRLEKKLNKTPDLTVFQLTSDRAECSECGAEMLRGELLFLEKQQPLCLACADSGRSGRSASGQALAADSIRLAVRAWIRHQHTDYDRLLMQGIPRDEARQQIAGRVDRVANSWAG
jgi:hypothetical protein